MKTSSSTLFQNVSTKKIKEYWDSRPCNLRHSSQEVGTKGYFDEVSQKKFFVEPHIVSFADFSSVKDQNILEIGCGLGTTAIQFIKSGARHITAIDLSEVSLSLAKKRAQVYECADKISFFQGNAEELSSFLPKNQYDLIFSFGVIHHTPYPEKVLKELHPRLSDQGLLKIMIYYRYSWKVFWILFKYAKGRFWRLSEFVATYSEAQTGCPVTYIYSKRQIRTLLASCGFEVIKTEVDHIFPYQIPEYVQHKYVKVWYFRWIPRPIFRALEKRFGWHLCVTAKKK